MLAALQKVSYPKVLLLIFWRNRQEIMYRADSRYSTWYISGSTFQYPNMLPLKNESFEFELFPFVDPKEISASSAKDSDSF